MWVETPKAKNPFIVGDVVFSRRHSAHHLRVKPYAHMDKTRKLEPLAKTWLVALEYLLLRVGIPVTHLDEKSLTKKKKHQKNKKPMKWCYVFTIPYYH